MELEKPSKFDIMLLKGRIGLSLVVRFIGCLVGGYVISNFLELNVVGQWLFALTLSGYAFWFTGRPYSATGLTHFKLAWRLLVKWRKRYQKPPEFMTIDPREWELPEDYGMRGSDD